MVQNSSKQSRQAYTIVFLLCVFTICWTILLLEAPLICTYSISREHSNQLQYEQAHLGEPISVGYIIGGQPWVKKWFVNNIKSILMHTKKVVHFHIVADKNTKNSLLVFSNTSGLRGVEFFFYDLEPILSKVLWIPNTHYSKAYGLAKLLLPDLMEDAVDKIIFLDVDTLFKSDINELWSEFENFNSSQLFGLAENMSNWYLNTTSIKKPWPARDRGVNTGVILACLKALRTSNWNHLWRQVAEDNLRFLGETTLADQDIFNAVFALHPEMLYRLDCNFNLQFGVQSIPSMCGIQPKIVHWNSGQKSAINDSHYREVEKYREEIESFNLDSISAVRSHFEPEAKAKGTEAGDELYCGERSPESSYPTLPDVFSHKSKETVVAIVTQMSTDRFENFRQLAQSTQFMISVAVFGTDDELKICGVKIARLNINNIAVHYVYKRAASSVYPINYLRNVALKYVSTEFIMLLDVDFVVLGDQAKLAQDVGQLKEKNVIILPAFESIEYSYETSHTSFPETKEILQKAYSKGQVQPFRANVWPQAHFATNFLKWFQHNESYKVEWRRNYEPYIVIRRSEAPLYDEKFTGFGWNKVVHILNLRLMNFTFNVQPEAYVIHQRHDPSQYLLRFRQDRTYRKCLHSLKTQFIRQSISNYYRL